MTRRHEPGDPLRIESKRGMIAGLDDWYRFAHPKRTEHWKAGRSAFEAARSWFGIDGNPAVPPEIASLLDFHEDTRAASITRVLPEYRVPFDSLPGEPRNTDVAALAAHPSGGVAISIEAKADETCDLPVRRVLNAAVRKISDDQRTNPITRIQQLADALLPARVDAFVWRMTGGRVRKLSDGRLEGPFFVPASTSSEVPISVYVGRAQRNVVSLEPARTERHPGRYDYRGRYPVLDAYQRGEGGAVYVGSRDGEHVIVSDARALADLLPEVEGECITVYTFESIAARDAYAADRFRSRAQRTEERDCSQGDLDG